MGEAALHIQLLGDFRLARDDVPLTNLNTTRLQALLAFLLLHRHAPQQRQHIAFQFWPDSTEGQARTNLRNLIHQLRQALPAADEFLLADTQTIQWLPSAPFKLDVAEFETHLAAGNLTAALEHYRGDLLPGLYDEWVLTERERLRNQFVAALEKRLTELEAARDYAGAVACAQRLVRDDAVREENHRHLIRLHALNGDRAAALHAYHTCATLLRRELDVEPSPLTRTLFEQVLNVEPLEAAPLAVESVPLIGRQAEWQTLRAEWQLASSGQPRVALISGEAGIGKTRLAEEMRTWAERLGHACAEAHCFQAEGALPFAPITAWLRARPVPALDEMWLVEISRLLPEVREKYPHLPPAPPLTEAWQRQRLFEALARAMQEGASSTLLVLEDAQWCDRETLEWLHYFFRATPAPRVLLLATERTEEHSAEQPLEDFRAALLRQQQLSQLPLERLNADETATLGARLTGQPLQAETAARLYQHTEGNPLFIVETVRAGLNLPERKTESHSALPPRVAQVLASRLNQLSTTARELAGVAATIGREFTYTTLLHASGQSDDTLVSALDELWQKRFIREQGAEAYDFSHARLRDAAYSELSAARRRLLHRKVAEALETRYARDLDSVSGQIAAHYEQAGSQEKAVVYYQKAATAARRVFANKEAVTLFRSALQLTNEPNLQAELKEGLADVLQLIGQRDEGRQAFREALALTTEDKPIDKARLCRKLAHSWWPEHGHQDEINQYFAQANALLESARLQASAAWRNEYIELALGRMWLGYWYFAPNEELETIRADVQPVVEAEATYAQRSRFYRSILLIQLKKYRWYMPPAETIRYGEMAIEVAIEGKDATAEAWGYGQLGFIYLWRNEFEPALYWFAKGIPLDERLGYVEALIIGLTYITLTYRKIRDLAQVKIYGEKALAVATPGNMPIYIGQAKANLGWLAWQEGRQTEAEALLGEAVKLIPPVFPMGWVVRWPLALIAYQQGRPAEVIEHLRVVAAPNQHRMPDEMKVAVDETIRLWDAGEAEAAQAALTSALDLAEHFLYL